MTTTRSMAVALSTSATGRLPTSRSTPGYRTARPPVPSACAGPPADVPLQALEDQGVVDLVAGRDEVRVHLVHADLGVRDAAVVGDDHPVQVRPPQDRPNGPWSSSAAGTPGGERGRGGGRRTGDA